MFTLISISVISIFVGFFVFTTKELLSKLNFITVIAIGVVLESGILSMVDSYKQQIEDCFGSPTAITKSVSSPTSHNTVPETAAAVTKPTASPYEIQLRALEADLVQNGQTKQLPISKTGNTIIILKP